MHLLKAAQIQLRLAGDIVDRLIDKAGVSHFKLILLSNSGPASIPYMDHIYKKIEITGSSSVSQQEAIENAVAKAGESIRNMRWFEVVETRGHIEDQKIGHWQVTIKIGFTID
jgi:dodecin